MIDSGLGAISVLNELLKQKKYNNYILYLDYKYNPFGCKNEESLLSRLFIAIDYLKKRKCEKIVIACNTLSVIALKYKIEEVITPINFFKEVISNNFDDNSILIATKNTIDSNVYNVSSIIASELVSYIEGENIDVNSLLTKIKSYDKIFLGCTHFSLLKKEFCSNKTFDSSYFLAKNIDEKNSKLSVEIVTTKLNKKIQNKICFYVHCHHFGLKKVDL